MTDNTENSHTSLTFGTLPQREKLTEKPQQKATVRSTMKKFITFKSAVNKESVYINPESPDLGLGLLFKTDNVGTRNFNQQQPPPVDSGTSVLCVSIVRSGPNRKQWDPGILYLNKGINTLHRKKMRTDSSRQRMHGPAQPPGSNYIVDMQPLNGPVLVCIKTGKTSICPENYVKCKDDLHCVDSAWVCDGDYMCPDNSDEDEDFCRATKCNEPDVKCKDGLQCVFTDFLCNGGNDCQDKSDEDADFCKDVRKYIRTSFQDYHKAEHMEQSKLKK
ncbi:Hypothetical predicted protein [Mytilus galloprovincialis]|uniref:Uncharacterized protein n=1 Tax=Mytilus galloprovincialis TaxID=29158 RepID=A0A8B6FNI2_MYTGA|nr:Hypothetical predicted protein [Mytilus galloprovincialis]